MVIGKASALKPAAIVRAGSEGVAIEPVAIEPSAIEGAALEPAAEAAGRHA